MCLRKSFYTDVPYSQFSLLLGFVYYVAEWDYLGLLV
jgi:hypothetical protein